jgi:DNA repair photolyase
MRIVYEPRGRALEYAQLAVSLYRWCSFKCRYCFVPAMFKSEGHLEPSPRKNAIALLKKDCEELERAGDKREILMSFTTDPYQPIDDQYGLTRKAIEVFHAYNRPYSILTKGGKRSMKDLDLMAKRPDLARYATTLTCMMPETAFKWEPLAAHWYERLDALKLAHRKGIKTWVSIEPIIVPWESRYLIAQSLGYVDLYRIGIMNHTNPGFPKTDLYEFIKSVKFILEWYQKPHTFKKDIQPYLQEIEKECKEFEGENNVT